jgi:hypothetical protein
MLTMQELEQAVRNRAVRWAELRFNHFMTRGGTIPPEWPGTLQEARALVDELSGTQLDDLDREPLAIILERRARSAWHQFRARR